MVIVIVIMGAPFPVPIPRPPTPAVVIVVVVAATATMAPVITGGNSGRTIVVVTRISKSGGEERGRGGRRGEAGIRTRSKRVGEEGIGDADVEVEKRRRWRWSKQVRLSEAHDIVDIISQSNRKLISI